MASSIQNELQSFGRNERGTIAIIFALALFIVFLITGLAIDLARATHAASKMSAALDSAALAGAKGIRLQNLTETQARDMVLALIRENGDRGGGAYGAFASEPEVLIDMENSRVEINAQRIVPTVLGQLAGVDQFTIPTTSVAIFEADDIEIGVQLDVTGSMGGTKIDDLKTATRELVRILIPDAPTGQKVRVGLAPYSAGVNAGPYARDVTDNRNAPNGCVYERRTAGFQLTDDEPTGTASLLTRGELGGGAQWCPAAEVTPLTESKAVLNDAIDQLQAGGTTAGHLGTAWAWYLLSPNWASVWPAEADPAPYRDGRTRKFAIVMTDGEYNTVNGVISNANVTPSSNFAKDTCEAMRQQGITVYTVGFRLTTATAIDVMNRCASPGGKAFLAENGAALVSAFQSIAENIVTLRLAR